MRYSLRLRGSSFRVPAEEPRAAGADRTAKYELKSACSRAGFIVLQNVDSGCLHSNIQMERNRAKSIASSD